MTAVANRHGFQTKITADAILQMHDIIAFFQIGEINVERGTRRQRVRRFLPARSLDFVTPENFRIGHDDEFRLVTKKTACERTDGLRDSRRQRCWFCLWTPAIRLPA
jgi:hypothetical protein